MPLYKVITGLFNSIPTGMILPFAGNVELEGWSLCDGSELNRTEYSDLFSVIGTTYGSGDGETTFNKPDFRNKTIWGDITAGIEKEAGLPNITGSFGSAIPRSHKVANPAITPSGAIVSEANSNTITANNTSDGTKPIANGFDASKSNSIYGNSETVQPPAITVRMMIKT
jgi:microcystin-dependent protein